MNERRNANRGLVLCRGDSSCHIGRLVVGAEAMTNPNLAAEDRMTREQVDADAILRKADIRLRERTMKAHKDETLLKGGTIAVLGYRAAITLARDCYTMGMMDAIKAIHEAKEANR